MAWVQLRDDGMIFLVRVGGVAVAEGRVLLHRMVGEDFWAVPGGRLQVGETAAQALRREMREEISADVQVGGLLWVIENFFEHWPLDATPGGGEPAPHHEIGLYLEMTLPGHLEHVHSFTGSELLGTQHEYTLEFRWFPLADIAGIDVRPSVLQGRLAEGLPAPAPLVVQRNGTKR